MRDTGIDVVDDAPVADAERPPTSMKDDDDEEEEWVRVRDSGTPCTPRCIKSDVVPTVGADVEVKWATPGAAPRSPLRLQALCPLCFTDTIIDPVLLHAATRATPDGGDEDAAVPTSASRTCCVACRQCVHCWQALQRDVVASSSLAESQSPTCPCCGQSTLHEAVVFDDRDSPVALQDMSEADLQRVTLVNVSTTEDDASVSALSLLVRRGAQVDGGDDENRETTLCGACEQPCATQFCLQCDIALCTDCVQTTHARGLYRSTHTVIPLAEARTRRQRRCGLHPGQVLELYCATCDVCACVMCGFAGAHTGHRIMPLAEVAATTRREVQSLCASLHAQAEASAQQERDLARLIPDYDTTVSHVEAAIRDNFASLHDALRRREAQLMHDLHEGSATMRTDMQSCIDTTALLSSALHDGCDRLTTLLARVDTVTLLRLKDRLAAQVLQRRETAAAQLRSLTHVGHVLNSCLGDGTLAHFIASPVLPVEACVDLTSQLGAIGALQLANGVAAALRQHRDDAAEADDAVQAVEGEYTTRLCGTAALPVPSLKWSGAVRLTEAHPVRSREEGSGTCPSHTACGSASSAPWSHTTLTIEAPSWSKRTAAGELTDGSLNDDVDVCDDVRVGKRVGLLTERGTDSARLDAQQYKRQREDVSVDSGLDSWHELPTSAEYKKKSGSSGTNLRLQWQM